MSRKHKAKGSSHSANPTADRVLDSVVPPAPSRAMRAGIMTVIVSVPFFLRVWIEHGDISLLAANVPLADVFIWLCAFVILLYTPAALRGRRSTSRRVIRKHHSISSVVSIEWTAFVIIAGLSLVLSSGYGKGVPEFVQCVDYYLLWFWIVARASRRGCSRDAFTQPAAVVLIAGVLLAAWQIWANTPTYLVRSVFRDHQTHVAAFVMLAPLVWCRLVVSPARRWGALGHGLAGLYCACLGSAAAMLFGWCVMGLASKLLGGRWFRRTGVVVCVSLIALLALPAGYRDALRRQPANWILVPMAERRQEVLLAKQTVKPPRPSVHFGLDSWRCFVASNIGHGLRDHTASAAPTSTEQQRVVVDYFTEAWSALGLITRGSLFGSGPGSWQDQIGTGYGILERTGTSFPNCANGYLMIGLTTGLLGLAAWLLAIRRTFMRGFRRLRFRNDGTLRERPLVAGCISGLVGAALFMFVCPFATQPVAVYWVALAALLHGMRPIGVVR